MSGMKNYFLYYKEPSQSEGLFFTSKTLECHLIDRRVDRRIPCEPLR